MGRHLTLVWWSEKCKRQLYGLAKDSVPAVECAVLAMKLKKLPFIVTQAANGIFKSREYGIDDVVGYYYGSLVDEYMTWLYHTTKTLKSRSCM